MPGANRSLLISPFIYCLLDKERTTGNWSQRSRKGGSFPRVVEWVRMVWMCGSAENGVETLSKDLKFDASTYRLKKLHKS